MSTEKNHYKGRVWNNGRMGNFIVNWLRVPLNEKRLRPLHYTVKAKDSRLKSQN